MYGLLLFWSTPTYGCRLVESIHRVQVNLDRLATIYAFLAVRIFQLKFANEQIEDISCEKILSSRAWKLL